MFYPLLNMTTEISTSSQKIDGRGKHPNSRANLIPFKPGQNGNPHPGYPLKERLQDLLRKPLKEPDKKAPAGEHVAYATLKGAIEREPTPFKEVWDRTEGKVPGDTVPPQNINIVFVVGKGYHQEASLGNSVPSTRD